jgi:hypothetical protein
MHPSISLAQKSDARIITGILREAALWLQDTGKPLWEASEFTEEKIFPETHLYYLVNVGSEVAGLFKLEAEDKLFWPDVGQDESLFIHKVVVRRQYAGTGLSCSILRYAVEETGKRGKKYLRLDCDAARPRLRAIYERFGFKHHSDRKVGPFQCARYEYKLKAEQCACTQPSVAKASSGE